MNALERLADYVGGEPVDEEAFEEELFGGGPAAAEAAFLDGIVRDARWLASRGTLLPAVTRRDADELLRSGRRIAYLDIGRDSDVEWTLPADAEQFLYRIGLDLDGVDRLDVEAVFGDQVVKVFPDVVFDREDGAVYAFCEAPLARLSAALGPCTVRFIAGGRGTRTGEIRTLRYDLRVA